MTLKTSARSWLPLIAASVATFGAVGPVSASSHREAPFITTVPKVDGTDFYMSPGPASRPTSSSVSSWQAARCVPVQLHSSGATTAHMRRSC